MVKFCSLSSGSSGNCQYIETEDTRLLIDAGFSGKRVEELLLSIDVKPNTIDAILVTHEHIDHTSGVGVLSRRYDIPIYANANTWEGMGSTIKTIKDKNTKIFTTKKYFEVGQMGIYPIGVYHDASDPVGYILYSKGIKVSVITDTGHIDDEIRNSIKDSDLYFIESNHDLKMLREGNYPPYLKKRIMGTYGHLSNDDAGILLGDILSGRGEIVMLGHLSQDNNIPKLAYDTVKKNILCQGLDADNDITLDISYRDKASCVYILE